MNNIIKQFRTHLERLGYSKTSTGMLPACTREFLSRYALLWGLSFGQEEKWLHQIESKDITAYHEYLQQRPNKRRTGGLSESYIHHHIYSLKVFFAWQEEKGAIRENPISCLAFKKPTTKPREVLTAHEVKELYNACETLKETAVLSIFYGCGLRRTEGEKLNLKDIHFRSGILYVREGKGSKRRAVPMSEKVNRDLKNYALKERFAKQNSLPRQSGETAFICNAVGTRTSGSSYNNILKKLLDKSGIKKEITLHSLRHSIATHLLESGLSVEYVRDFLGHKHMESTQIYTRVKNKQLWNLMSI